MDALLDVDDCGDFTTDLWGNAALSTGLGTTYSRSQPDCGQENRFPASAALTWN
ncbi:MAG: hypothetical protein O3A00_23740 [Planctomycetota bacterium]|nr:hypothetical protein [Planctomycetota bacterium]